MAQPSEAKLNALLAAVAELQTAYNQLRFDFRRHDHGATYTTFGMRMTGTASVSSITESGSPSANSAVDDVLPAKLFAV